MALNHCRNCGYLTETNYCGNPECMETLARAAASMRTWAGRAMFVVLVVGVATALFVTFFENRGWQEQALRWAFEHEQYDIAVAIVDREWAGFTADQWTALGVVTAGLFGVVAQLASLAVAIRLRAVPGLRAEMHRQLARRWKIEQAIGALALLPLSSLIVSTVAMFASPVTNAALRRHASRVD